MRAKYLIYIAVASVSVGAAAIFGVIAFGDAHPLGFDGYYYAAQMKSYFSKGRFFSRDTSIYLWGLVGVSKMIPDAVVSTKLYNASWILAGVVAYYRFARIFLGVRGALAACSLLTASILWGTQIVQYPKQFSGIVLALFGLVDIHRFIADRKKRITWNRILLLRAILFLIAATLTHKMIAGLLLLIALGYLFTWIPQHKKIHAGLILILVFIAAVVILVFNPLPHGLHWTDFIRFQKIISPSFSNPIHAVMTSYGQTSTSRIEIWGHFLVGYVAFFFSVAHKNSSLRMLSFISIIVFANPFLNYHPQEVAIRIFAMNALTTPIILIMMISILLQSRIAKNFTASLSSRASLAFLALLIVAALASLAHNLHDIVANNPLQYSEIADVVSRLNLPKNHLLIVHQGFDYYYCYQKKGDAFHFLPEYAHRDRPLYRLAFGLPEYIFKKPYLKDIEYTRYSRNYTLFQESDWQKIISYFEPFESRQIITWQNPQIERPEYLRRKYDQR